MNIFLFPSRNSHCLDAFPAVLEIQYLLENRIHQNLVNLDARRACFVTIRRSPASFLWYTQPLRKMSTSSDSGGVSHFGSQTNYLQSFCTSLWMHNQNKGVIQCKWQDTFNHLSKHQRERLCGVLLFVFSLFYVFNTHKTQCTLCQMACLYRRKTFNFKKGKIKTELDIHSLHTSAR